MTDLFTFDIFSFSYYLAHHIGDVEPAGIAYVINKRITFKKNWAKGFPKADLDDDKGGRVYGVLYRLDDKQLSKLKEKVLEGYRLKLMPVQLNRNRSAVTLVPEITDTTVEQLPYRWYTEVMAAALAEVRAPLKYIEKIDQIPTDHGYHFNGSLAKAMLKYPGTPKKYFDDAIEMINKLVKGGSFVLDAKRHLLNGRNIQIVKDENGFTYETSVKIKKGLQTHKDLIENNPDLVLSNQYQVPAKGFVVNHIEFGDTDKIVAGSIQTIKTLKLPDECYWRVMVPIAEKMDITRDFQYWSFLYDGRIRQGMIKLQVNGQELHFYGIRLMEKNYAVIDLLHPSSMKSFNEVSHAINLVYAVLKGKYYSGEGFYLAYKDAQMKKPVGLVYQELRNGIYNNPAMFTTNPYTGIDKIKFRRNKHGAIPKKLIKSIEKDMTRFNEDHYSALVQLILKNDKILRAISQIVYNQSTSLEIKIPILYVALESITAAIATSGDKALKPIEDNKLFNKLAERLKAEVGQFAKDNGFSQEQVEKLQPILGKITNLNSPINADKLSKTFPLLGYTLTPDDEYVISKRNLFLHGNMINLQFPEEEYGFRELYGLSLRLNFLLVVLLLKSVGFSGRIINYNRLFEHITKIPNAEDVLVLI